MGSDVVDTKALERLKRKLTVENLWIYVIKILKDCGELRAYDIKKELASRFHLKPATVTVYAVIYKMSKEGLIEGVKVSGEVRYRATERGLKALEEGIRFLDEVLNRLVS